MPRTATVGRAVIGLIGHACRGAERRRQQAYQFYDQDSSSSALTRPRGPGFSIRTNEIQRENKND
jgi:hypothetical protein